VINCPRCGVELEMHDPDAKWKRFFECSSCWVTWHFERIREKRGKFGLYLFQGRELRDAGALHAEHA